MGISLAVGLQYEVAHLALQRALPELRPCVERLVADWDEFDGQPPGQYIVFNGTYTVWIQVLVSLANRGPEARALLQRALNFAEELLTSNREVVSLGLISCAEWLDTTPGGREVAAEMGGPALRQWMAEYSRDNWTRTGREIIDLWGVREAIAAQLPEVPLYEIPGITQPAAHHLLESLGDARASADGVVMLYAFGMSGMFVLARGSVVHCGEDELLRLAVELAPVHHKSDADGKPGLLYLDIPAGEKVWNMTIGVERHARLNPEIDIWMAPSLTSRHALTAVLRGSS